MISLLVWPKVITVSSFYCISIYPDKAIEDNKFTNIFCWDLHHKRLRTTDLANLLEFRFKISLRILLNIVFVVVENLSNSVLFCLFIFVISGSLMRFSCFFGKSVFFVLRCEETGMFQNNLSNKLIINIICIERASKCFNIRFAVFFA